jgi:hypothetical protein
LPSLIKYIGEYDCDPILISGPEAKDIYSIPSVLQQTVRNKRPKMIQKYSISESEMPIPLYEIETQTNDCPWERYNAILVLPKLMRANDVFWTLCYFNERNITVSNFTSVIDNAGMLWINKFAEALRYSLEFDVNIRGLKDIDSHQITYQNCKRQLITDLMQKHSSTDFWSTWQLDPQGVQHSGAGFDERRRIYEEIQAGYQTKLVRLAANILTLLSAAKTRWRVLRSHRNA